MAMTVKDLDDFKRLLVTHPEWRAELRQLILPDELLTLPALVRELVEAQQRTEERVKELAQAQQRTEERVKELAQAQQRTEERVEQLTEAQKRIEERLGKIETALLELVQAQTRTEIIVGALAGDQKKMRDDIADLRGWRLEQHYARYAHAYFGRQLRRIRVIIPGGLDAATEDALEARLTLQELQDVLLLDVLAVGKLRQPAAAEESDIWLAVEVSAVIDRHDVERALERAVLLRKAGFRAVPIVAGEALTTGATRLLADAPVILTLDGRIEGWERALAAT